MNIIDRTNPNLVIILHYCGKALWILLAAFFGYVGLRLYSIGITGPANASANILGIEVNLENAAPGLIVMVMALVSSVIGAVRSKLEITEGGVSVAAAPVEPLSDTEPPRTLYDLEHVWGLTEIAMLRIPLSLWASKEELNAIRSIQTTSPHPEKWPHKLSEIARRSEGFMELLRHLSSQYFDKYAINTGALRLSEVDFELPWCARLRWSSAEHVDVFVCVTGGVRNVSWQTFKEST